MKIKRPNIVLFERREVTEFSFEDLVAGGAGIATRSQWIALAPHLDGELEITLEDLAVIDAIPVSGFVEREPIAARVDAGRLDALVAAGLVLCDDQAHATWRARDALLDSAHWWAPAAVAHGMGRWQDVDVAADERRQGKLLLSEMLEDFGLPPPASLQVRPSADWQPLPAPAQGELDALLRSRATCRNFATTPVPLVDLATVLHRAFGAQASQVLAPGAVMLKKNSPSGGGLHPVEAYVLAQRVDGLAPGLYHYECVAHALEPMQRVPSDALAAMAHELVAGQEWFADAPVLVLMAARFERNFWKYRKHPKAWKVVLLDAGHLSQTFYLGATQLGYGAFVTGAINDRCAERLFELDGLATGAIAVCGMGRRAVAAAGDSIEFDPLGLAARG